MAKTKNTAFTIRVDQDEWLEREAKEKILNKSILVRVAIDLLMQVGVDPILRGYNDSVSIGYNVLKEENNNEQGRR